MYVYKEMLVPEEKYVFKCPYEMTPQFIVVHNTANDASAESEVKYMIANNYSVSFHYAVDDKTIIKAIPENRNAFHAGDGKNGKGNRYGLSVEICYSKSGGEKFIKAEENAAKFISELLKSYGWDTSKVKKHQDFSGKYCPHRTIDMGWDRFLNMIREEGKTVKKLKDIEGHYAEKHIQDLYDMGVINGDENGNFRPDDKLTRADAAIMVRNAIRAASGR